MRPEKKITTIFKWLYNWNLSGGKNKAQKTCKTKDASIFLFKEKNGCRYNAEYTDQCTPLEVERIEWATKMVPNEGVLKFNHNADTDGFVPDMTANTKVTNFYLQLKVIIRPSNAVFELSCQYNSNTNTYTLNVSLLHTIRVPDCVSFRRLQVSR